MKFDKTLQNLEILDTIETSKGIGTCDHCKKEYDIIITTATNKVDNEVTISKGFVAHDEIKCGRQIDEAKKKLEVNHHWQHFDRCGNCNHCDTRDHFDMWCKQHNFRTNDDDICDSYK